MLVLGLDKFVEDLTEISGRAAKEFSLEKVCMVYSFKLIFVLLLQIRDNLVASWLIHSSKYRFSYFRAIFVWPWNENPRTKQKQQTNGNRAIWLVYRTDTNARGFWLVKRTLGWRNFMPENFLEINRDFALTSYCNMIGQLNNSFSILGFSLAGKRRGHVLIFSSTGW